MSEYVIMTDSGCDISPEKLSEWGVGYSPLSFRFNDGKEHFNDEMPAHDFYEKMRLGDVSKTSAVNSDSFINLFDKPLSEGKDILYIGFSSGISCTYNSARLAAEEMGDRYPDRNVITIDTLAASAGEGLILYLAVMKKRAGATLFENEEYIRGLILKVAHWFTVEDLIYLKRGGRVSAVAAFAGGVLNIKPVMHVDNEGKLVNVSKVRGRAASIRALADKYLTMVDKSTDGTYFISHGDCIEDAKTLEGLIEAQTGKKCTLITDVGAVIGSHSGPGTLALFFIAGER